MASNPDVVFKGITPRYTRGWTKQVLHDLKPKRVCIPCVGAFTLAGAAVEAGIPPEEIYTCDIVLYSSVLGAFLAGEDIDVQPTPEWAWLTEYMQDTLGKVAAVIMGIRILQYSKQSIHQQVRRRNLIERFETYYEQARQNTHEVYEQIGGLHYRAEDLRDLIDRHIDDPDCVTMFAPPCYYGKNDRFAGLETIFEWEPPPAELYTDAENAEVMPQLAEAPGLVLVYRPITLNEGHSIASMFGEPWVDVWADKPGISSTAAVSWVAANRPLDDHATLRRSDVTSVPKAKYKLFSEGEITPDMDFRFVKERREVVEYYRDLLVHQLALAPSERYYVLMLDGKLVGTVGFFVADIRQSSGRKDAFGLTFAFSPRHPDYPRLHKLVLMACVSSWAFDQELKPLEDMPGYVQTTMLSQYPEVKTARGIFNLRNRERQKDGMYKLSYYAPIAHRTPKETIEEWLERYGNQ